MIMRIAFALAIAAAAVAVPAAQEAGSLPAHVPVRGPSDAPVLVTVFAPLRAPSAARAAVVLRALHEEQPRDVRIAFRHHPADGVPDAADHALRAAHAQGKFWEMHDLVLGNQDRSTLTDLIGMARQLGLDVEAFSAAMPDAAGAIAIDADVAEARRLKLPDGLAVFVDGTPVAVPLTLPALKAAIAERLRR